MSRPNQELTIIELAAGLHLAGRYRIESRIGRGSGGVVYRAWDKTEGRMVCVKVLHSGLEGNRDSRLRFEREYRLLSQLDHPGICRVFDFGEDGGASWLAMELIEGDTLSAYLKRGPLPQNLALRVARSASAALGAAHAQGIVHRDVKPGNIMIDDDGRVVLLDFGIALSDGDERLTRPGFLLGSSHYVAPEIWQGKPPTAASDVWSLGVVLYACLTGRRPFWSPDPIRLVEQILTSRPARPRVVNPEASLVVERGVDAALTVNPAFRPATGDALLSVFDDVSSTGNCDEPTRSMPNPARVPREITMFPAPVSMMERSPEHSTPSGQPGWDATRTLRLVTEMPWSTEEDVPVVVDEPTRAGRPKLALITTEEAPRRSTHVPTLVVRRPRKPAARRRPARGLPAAAGFLLAMVAVVTVAVVSTAPAISAERKAAPSVGLGGPSDEVAQVLRSRSGDARTETGRAGLEVPEPETPEAAPTDRAQDEAARVGAGPADQKAAERERPRRPAPRAASSRSSTRDRAARRLARATSDASPKRRKSSRRRTGQVVRAGDARARAEPASRAAALNQLEADAARLREQARRRGLRRGDLASLDDALAAVQVAHRYLAKHADEAKGDFLEQAWSVIQAVLADGEVEDEDKAEALKRAVEIAPKIREELGQAWLDESFTERPQRGMEILSVIGSAASKGQVEKARDNDYRFKSLELQTTAAKAVLAAAPELANEWRDTLQLLAANWLREAQYTNKWDTSTSRRPGLTRDPFGNYYYYNYNSQPRYNQSMPLPISTDNMLEIRPSDEWLAMVVDGLKPKFSVTAAQLLLKVNEDTEAFPYIEKLAQTHPDLAEDLVEEFLRVWTTNHNPNTTSRTNNYMFIYGFEQRASGIPLTRSKQERNLAELSDLIARLRKLPLENIDEELIAKAFTAAHSTAEVYRIETIEKVFGSLANLEPKTMAELVQKMRSNLVGVWREPSVQKDKKTNRRQKDIQNEVLRGYEVARGVVEAGLKDHPDDWSLVLAHASVLHDENNFRQEVKKSSEFAARRGEAFDGFKRAAELYRDGVVELGEEDETAKAYITWFYASLGDCDLNAIDHEKQPDARQLELIKDALAELPEEVAERHVGLFANSLFTRMSSVNPAVKYRYVESGLSIVGDHERAQEAQEVFEYYSDLVTEIVLDTEIDGSDTVGHETPFGLFVNIRHTKEIEREAGGFSKYLVNQNNQSYGYNYGRPLEDYRDKFEEAARDSLQDHFEVQSITFNHPDTHSRETDEYGWRVTPYAYLLLKPRGPEIDRIPSLRLDLDFLDTTGYAVLPVESSPVPIDAKGAQPRPMNIADLELTQTLDERQARDGKLVLEVKATALGLVPDLDELLDLQPKGFDITELEDQGVSVVKFDEEADDTAIVSERLWMISMAAQGELTELPEEFQFGVARVDEVDMAYQRFVDADLASVGAVVPLEMRYGEVDRSNLVGWSIGGFLLVLAAVLVVLYLRRSGTESGPTARFRMPDNVSPFTVIGLLRQIESNNGVTETQRSELEAQIALIEGYYFEDEVKDAPDLRSIAQTWVGRVS